MNQVKSWKPVVSKFSSKLSLWKAKSLSIGGRYTLVKSILNSLPLYYLSLFRALKTVIQNLEVVRNEFFWGDVGHLRKIVWAKSIRLYGDYEGGGLKIGSLEAKSLALLGKWWWRYHREPMSLWARLITSIYGVEGGLGISKVSTAGGYCPAIISAGRLIDSSDVVF